jgi:hypothetical protein
MLRGGERLREGDDGADIEIAIRPPVHPMADARRGGVIHGGMTQGAGDAQLDDVIGRIHRGLYAHDRVHLEQGHRGGRALQVHRAQDTRRQDIGIDFEPDLERGGRVDGLLHNFVQAERVRPEGLIAERVEAKGFPAIGHGIGHRDGAIGPGRDRLRLLASRAARGQENRQEPEQEGGKRHGSRRAAGRHHGGPLYVLHRAPAPGRRAGSLEGQ